jgi:hypothetical protein
LVLAPSAQAVSRVRQQTARRLAELNRETPDAPDLSLPHFAMPQLPALGSPADMAWLAEVHKRGLPAVHAKFAISEAQVRLHALAFLHPSYWPPGPVRGASMLALEPRGASTIDFILALQPKAVGMADAVTVLGDPDALHAAAVASGWDTLIRERRKPSSQPSQDAPASAVPVAVTAACVRSTLGLVHITFGIDAAIEYAATVGRLALQSQSGNR